LQKHISGKKERENGIALLEPCACFGFNQCSLFFDSEIILANGIEHFHHEIHATKFFSPDGSWWSGDADVSEFCGGVRAGRGARVDAARQAV
jgi:hypothetical protein